MLGLKQDIAKYMELGWEQSQKSLQEKPQQIQRDISIDYTPEI
jgi:hypothetical protein